MKTSFSPAGRSPGISCRIISLVSIGRCAATRRAFTRLELLALLCALALLAAVALPVLAGSRQRSEQVTCLNNLRQLGLALQMWSSDHGGRVPWWAPYSDGGLQYAPAPLNGVAGNVFFHFLWMSNEVGTPRILACPGDPQVKVASDFSRNPATGFANPGFQNMAVSYFIGTDIFDELVQGIVCGDRNMKTNAFPAGCSSAIQRVAQVNRPATIGWSPGMHLESGNLLLNDGRVIHATDQELRTAVDKSDDYGYTHFAFPR